MAKQSAGKEAKPRGMLKKIADHPFFTNDGTLTQYLAHGANEFVNITMSGHTAPLYARYVSPNLQNQDVDTPDTEKSSSSLIDKHLSSIGVTTKDLEPALAVSEAPNESLIDSHLKSVTSTSPEPTQPEQEPER